MAFCNKCGSEIDSKSTSCIHCGAPVTAGNREVTPADNSQPSNPPVKSNLNTDGILIWAILISVILCCFPLGIPGIIYAVKAKNAASYEEARRALDIAKVLCIIGTVIGVIFIVIGIIAGITSPAK